MHDKKRSDVNSMINNRATEQSEVCPPSDVNRKFMNKTKITEKFVGINFM